MTCEQIKEQLNAINPGKFNRLWETNREVSAYLPSLIIRSIIFTRRLILALPDDFREYFILILLW